MATKQQIATRVLQKLVVLENQEVIDPLDEALIIESYDSAYALLEFDGLVTWGSGDDIPIQAELSIIDYVAHRVMGSFTVRPDISQKLPTEAKIAERDLCSLTISPYVPDVTPSNAY